MKTAVPKKAPCKWKEENSKPGGCSKCGKNNNDSWKVLQAKIAEPGEYSFKWIYLSMPRFGRLEYRDTSNFNMDYGTGLTLLHRGSDVSAGHLSMQDGSAKEHPRKSTVEDVTEINDAC
ncbi:hypothetical protein ARMGADRAFT_1032709 [Armillaria gallica]|uniref:Uncharacterized protein n=1 Tax=Armillaria gallica TaxID=47427 RepID=A0A2H3DM17_ARMGA|nr:hypothetical protein ARMGADRAFT_1032709 [Armillaria gallica]